MLRSLWPLVILLLFRLDSQAQQLFNDDLTENFFYSVQTIDDFFNRFNYSSDVPAFNKLKEQNANNTFNRRLAVLSLFDQHNSNWNLDDVAVFCNQFECDSTTFLNYEESN